MNNEVIAKRLDAQHILLKSIFDALTTEQKSEIEKNIKKFESGSKVPAHSGVI